MRSKISAAKLHKQATISDVARLADVSIATVSRVINGAKSVDPGLAERVHAARAALNYQPNRAARSLAGKRSSIIGVLVPDIVNPFFIEIVRGVEDVARRNHFLIIQCSFMVDPQLERQYIGLLASEPIAGIIVVPTHAQKTALSVFTDKGIPVVAVDQRVDDRDIDAVLIDNVSAAKEATAHLIANGYRRIGLICGPVSTTTGRGRRQGYRLALQEAGITYDPAIEQIGTYEQESGYRQACKLLAVEPRIDALVTCNNRLTVGALTALQEHGWRVPDDLGLAVFDDLPWGVSAPVPLTTVVQPAYELGSTAAGRLIQRLHHPESQSRQEVLLSHRFRVGESTRPIATTTRAAATAG